MPTVSALPRNIALSVLLLLLCAGTASGQRAFTFRKTGLEAGGSFFGSWTSYVELEDASRFDYREWVGFQLEGEILSPRFLTFDARLRPSWLQVDWHGPGALIAAKDQTSWLDLVASTRLFPSSLVSLFGTIERSAGTSPGAFGQRTDFKYAGWEAGLQFKPRWLPMELSYRDRAVNEVFHSPEVPEAVRQDVDIRTATWLAQNSKLRLLGEHVVYDDRAGPADFVSDEASLLHRFSWGKGSELGSALDYFNRAGSGGYQRKSWRESLHLQHTRAVESDYGYTALRNETRAGSVQENAGNLGVTIRPFPALMIGGDAQMQSDRFLTGSRTYSRLGPRGRVTTSLPGRGRLTAGGSLGWERVRQDAAADVRIPVINERHVVSSTGRFLLENGNVDLVSVVLTDVTQATTFQQGFDYQLFASGTLVEVLTLPAGRIAPGDTVLASYSFQLFPSGRTDALLAQYDVMLTMVGVDVYHRRAKRTGAGNTVPGLGGVVAGNVFNISDRDDIATGIRAAWSLGRGSLQLAAERQQMTTVDFAFRGTTVRGVISQPLGSSLMTSVSADWSSSASGDFTRVAEMAQGTLDWFSFLGRSTSLRLLATASAWRWDETPGTRQAFLGGTFQADLAIRKLTVQVRYDYNNWRYSYADRESRLFFTATRGF